jgi:hypothetical protein
MIHVRHAAAAIASGLCETVLITRGESGRSGVGRTRPIGDWDWTDPASGSNFGMRYEIRFPAYEGPPAVRCTMDFFCDSDELPEAFLDTCDDRMAWLTDYVARTTPDARRILRFRVPAR